MAKRHRPTDGERDERVRVDLDPAEFIAAVPQTGPLPDEDEEVEQAEGQRP